MIQNIVPLPSLTDSLRSVFGCGERDGLTGWIEISLGDAREILNQKKA